MSRRNERKQLEARAAEGDSEAMYKLGRLVEEDHDLVTGTADRAARREARSWWEKAANLNNVLAMIKLGDLASWESNPVEARSWYEKALNLNYRSAMFNLGSLEEWQGNLVEARNWYEKYLNVNEDIAMFCLGRLAQKEGDLVEARSWYEKAAALGHTNAPRALKELEPKQRWWQK